MVTVMILTIQPLLSTYAALPCYIQCSLGRWMNSRNTLGGTHE